MTEILSKPAALVLISAIAYAAATVAMKVTSQNGSVLVVGVVALCLTAAVLAEIVLLRQIDLGLAYVAILGLESLGVLAFAWAIGDPMGLRQMLGGGCVLVGALMLTG